MPPEYFAMALSPASSRPNRPSRSSAVVRACFDDRPSRRPNSQRFSRPVRFSSTEAYCPVDAEQLADDVGVLAHVDAEQLGAAAVHREQGGEHLQHRGLAGAVGAQHAEHLAAVHVEVDAVDGAHGRRRS